MGTTELLAELFGLDEYGSQLVFTDMWSNWLALDSAGKLRNFESYGYDQA